jgi:hypothetical protein
MKRWVVSAAVTCVVGCAGLAFAAPALAEGAFYVVANDTHLARTTGTELDLSLPSEDASPAAITIYVPSGYGANLTQSSGDVAQVDATLDAHGTQLRRQGSLVVADPNAYTTSACAPGRHAVVWLLRILVGARTIEVPLFVDPTGANEASLGAYKLQMCFGSTEAPEAAGGAPLGARLTEAEIYFPNTFTNPSTPDVYAWHMLVTTYIPGTSTLNPAVVELRALAYFPSTLSVRPHYVAAKHRFVVSGVYHAGKLNPAGAPVFVLAGTSPSLNRMHVVALTRTKRGGRYSVRVKRARGPYFAAVTFNFPNSTCTTPGSAASAGCISETESPTYSAVVKAHLRR